jgi:hypothetical protein
MIHIDMGRQFSGKYRRRRGWPLVNRGSIPRVETGGALFALFALKLEVKLKWTPPREGRS